jgi:hypothetical protein
VYCIHGRDEEEASTAAGGGCVGVGLPSSTNTTLLTSLCVN